MDSEDPTLGSRAYKARALLAEPSPQPLVSLTFYLPCPITYVLKSCLALVSFSELVQPLGSPGPRTNRLTFGFCLSLTQDKRFKAQSRVLSASQPDVHPVWGLGSECGMDGFCHHSPPCLDRQVPRGLVRRTEEEMLPKGMQRGSQSFFDKAFGCDTLPWAPLKVPRVG